MEPKRKGLSLFLSFLEMSDLEKILGGQREVPLCISIEATQGTGTVLWE